MGNSLRLLISNSQSIPLHPSSPLATASLFSAWERLVSCFPIQVSPWRREWQPAPVSLPGESHGQRSLAGPNESDATERLSLTQTSKLRAWQHVASLAECSFSPTVRSAPASAGGDSLSSPGGRQEGGLHTNCLAPLPQIRHLVHLWFLSVAAPPPACSD